MSKEIKILNILLLFSAISWVALLVSSSGTLIIALFFIFIFCSCFAFSVFVWKRRRLGYWVLLSFLFWGFTATLSANYLIKTSRSYWTGFHPDIELGWYPAKNMKNVKLSIGSSYYQVSTDKFGHRNDLPYPEDGKLDYIVQGDSNIFGYGLKYQDTICQQIKRLLPGIQLYNFGIPGFDLNHYYFQYKKFSKQFSIKNRILILNSENDFTLSALKTAYYIKRPYLEVAEDNIFERAKNIAALPTQGYDNLFIDKYKSFNSLIHYPARDWMRKYPKFIINTALGERIIGKLHLWIYYHWPTLAGSKLGELRSVIYNPAFLQEARTKWPQPFRQFSRDFRIIIKKIKQQNKNLFIFILPMQSQVTGIFSSADKGLGFNNYLRKICLDLDIKFADPTLLLRAEKNTESLFLKNDHHYSARGTKICAKVLVKELQGMGTNSDEK